MRYPTHCFTKDEYLLAIQSALFELLSIYLVRLLIESDSFPPNQRLANDESPQDREVYLLSMLKTYARCGVVRASEYNSLRASIFKDWATDIGRNLFDDPF